MNPNQQKVYDNIICNQLCKRTAAKPENCDGAEFTTVSAMGDSAVSTKITAKSKKQLRAQKELQDLLSCTGPVATTNTSKRNTELPAMNDYEVVDIDSIIASGSQLSTTTKDIDELLTKMKTSDINNMFTALKKAANHPLMLRVRYTDEAVIDLIARICLASGHYGDQADYEKVRAEICRSSDFDINRICIDHHSSLGHLQLADDSLYDSVKMSRLKELLPQLVVSLWHDIS